MVKCPRCGRQNPDDALFCGRCGQRLGGRASGVTYRQRQQAGGFGIGQGILALLVVVLAGVVIAGGAFAVVFLWRPPAGLPTNSPIAVLPSESPSLSPSASPSFTPSPLVTPSPTFLFPTASPSVFPSASPLLTPSPTPFVTPPPTPQPTPPPTPRPTPQPTPVECRVASQGPTREFFLGVGNDDRRGPRGGIYWCVHQATFRMVFGSTFGEVRLMRGNRVLASADCTWPDGCPQPVVANFEVPREVQPDSALRYEFNCQGDPLSFEDECNDGTPDGATIEIAFEPIEGP